MYDSSGVHQHDELLDIILAFNRETRYDRLLNILLEKMMELTNSDAGTLYLLNDKKLHFHIVKNKSLGITQQAGDVTNLPPIPLDANFIDNVCAHVAIHQRLLIIDDIYTDTRFSFSGPKNYDCYTGYRTKSMLVLPMISVFDNVSETLGVIQLINATDKETGLVTSYSNIMDESVLLAINNIAANILSNFLHIQEADLLFSSLVDVTSQAIGERSAYSKNHTQNVSKYCRAFAEYLCDRFKPGDKYYFDAVDIRTLTLAALLHDIGKIVTPIEIMDKSDRLGPVIVELRHRFAIKGYQLEIALLEGKISRSVYKIEKESVAGALDFIEAINSASAITDDQLEEIRDLGELTYVSPEGKTLPLLTQDEIDALSIRRGTLTPKERRIMQEHVVITGRLLDKIPFPERYKKAPMWARNHHEFLNGTGYPKGLKAKDIDIGSRILTIADIFDALVSRDRPYKTSIPVGRSLLMLDEMAKEGKLDKELVQLFRESKAWEGIVNQD